MKDRDIHTAIRILRREVPKWETPIVTLMAETYESPFRVLISCILSLRTQDSTTAKASHRLFAVADTPQAMSKLSAKKIEKLIYPVGFYKTKAKNILEICRTLIDQYGGKVPDEIDELLKVQRRRAQDGKSSGNPWLQKTGNLRRHARAPDLEPLGLRRHENPEKTEMALRAKLPKQYWIEYNDLLVSFGQHLCRPISPVCSDCPVKKYCRQMGVTTRR